MFSMSRAPYRSFYFVCISTGRDFTGLGFCRWGGGTGGFEAGPLKGKRGQK